MALEGRTRNPTFCDSVNCESTTKFKTEKAQTERAESNSYWTALFASENLAKKLLRSEFTTLKQTEKEEEVESTWPGTEREQELKTLSVVQS